MAVNAPSAPLRCWGLAVVLVILFVGGCLVWHRLFPVLSPPANYAIERLKTTTDDLRIVAVGNSLMRHGLPFDQQLEQQALAHGLSLKFTRLTQDLGLPRQFAVFLPHILAAKPDWVFLQAAPLTINYIQKEPSLLTSIFNKINEVKNRFRTRKNIPLTDNGLFIENSQAAAPYTGDYLKHPERIIPNQKWRENFSPREPILNESFENFFKLARAQGSRVVILEMGRSRLGNEGLPSEFHHQLTANLNQLVDRYAVELWRFPANLPIKYYVDLGHLNSVGQKVFVDWFLGRLRDEISKKND